MPTTLASGRNVFQPPSFARSNKGELFIVNGIDVPQRWDGTTSATETMGIDAPSTACTLGSSGAGSLTGTYYAYVRFIDDEGIPSSLSPISAVNSPASKAQFDYTSVPVSSDSRVTKRQLFRNTNGQVTTFYLDGTINDNSTTTATTTNTDAQLLASTALPILAADGGLNANRFTAPPNHKAYIATLHDRHWMAGDVIYDQGSCEVTNGSATVTGRGTAWTAAMAARSFYVQGDTASYTISSVNAGAQTITLTGNYGGTTTKFAQYAIRPIRDERHKVYVSAAGEPESMPPSWAFKIQEREDSDDVSGLMPLGVYVFVLLRNSIHRVSFNSDPVNDIASSLTSSRGCENNRCWVMVEDFAYLLDQQGVHRFNGGHNGGQSDHISEQIQDYWRDGKINWRASKFFFTSHNPQQEMVRFHVCLGGDYLPRHALCYHYRHEGWCIEEYPWYLGGEVIAQIANQKRCLLGGEYANHWLQNEGTFDGVFQVSAGHTIRGAVTAASLVSITDSAASFPASGLTNAPVAIISGRGKGQVRRIVASTSTKLTIKHRWAIKPDTTSVYQIGGVRWRVKSGAFQLPRYQDEGDTARAYKVVAEPTENAATLDLRMYLNHETTPRSDFFEQDQGDGVVVTNDSPDVVMTLTHTGTHGNFSGYRSFNVNQQMVDPRFSDNWVSAELRGFQDRDKVVIYSLGLEGVE